MMTKEKIDRINELAAKAKTPQGLTESEIEEGKKVEKMAENLYTPLSENIRQKIEKSQR